MEWIIEANDPEEAAEGKFAFIRQVVRCKDCKFYVKNNPTVLCLRDSGNPEWFCGDGKRRE